MRDFSNLCYYINTNIYKNQVKTAGNSKKNAKKRPLLKSIGEHSVRVQKGEKKERIKRSRLCSHNNIKSLLCQEAMLFYFYMRPVIMALITGL